MKFFTTELMSIDPTDGQLKKWCGPNVPGISWEDAEWFCQNKGFGYLTVTGELIMEIGTRVDENGFIVPDFDNVVDYENLNLN